MSDYLAGTPLAERGIVMRKYFVAVAVLGIVGSTFLPAPAAQGDQFGCTASQPVASAVSSSPTCSFNLVCSDAQFCDYTARLDVNGGGQVFGLMFARPVREGTTEVSWVDFITGAPADAPSCQGLFSCSGGTEELSSGQFVGPLLAVRGVGPFPGWATVTCSGGGSLAVFVTITCSVQQ